MIRRWLPIATIIGTVLLMAWFWMMPVPPQVAPPPTSAPTVSDRVVARVGPPEVYPRADLNPGLPNPDITQDNIAETICNKNWKTSSIRPPASYTTRIKIKQITEYGFNDTNTRDYEEDHIISLENGGHPRDPKNLYPEAYDTEVNGQRVGAREKDQVENYVHNGICLDIPNAKFSVGPKPSQALTLEQGQQILRTDWYRCYLHLQERQDCLP